MSLLLTVTVIAAPAPQLKSASPLILVASPDPQTITVTGARLQLPLRAFLRELPNTTAYQIGTVENVTGTGFRYTAIFDTPGTFALFVRNPDSKKSNELTITVTVPQPPPEPTPGPVPVPEPTPVPTPTPVPPAEVPSVYQDPTVGPDPVEPLPTPALYARIKSPAPRMHFTAGFPIRLFADAGDGNQWMCGGLCPDQRVRFYIDGALVATLSPNPAGVNHWEYRHPGLPVGTHVATMDFTPHAADNSGGPVVQGAVPVTFYVDPVPAKQNIVNLTSDFVVAGPLDWTDALVNCQGFTVSSAVGNRAPVTIRRSLLTGCAEQTITTTDTAILEDVILEDTGTLSVSASTITTTEIEVRANSRVSYSSSNPDASPVLNLTATGASTFTNARIGFGGVQLRGGSWTVDRPITMGPRAVLRLSGVSSPVVRNPYLHHEYRNGSSQGFNLVFDSVTNALVEDFVIRDGSWPFQGVSGEIRNGVVINHGGHNAWRSSASGTKIHHNIFTYQWHPGMSLQGELMFYLCEQNLQIDHNTFDFGGPSTNYTASVLAVHPCSQVGDFHSNAVTGRSGSSPLVSGTGTIVANDHNGEYADPQFVGARDDLYKVQEGRIWNRELAVEDVLAYYRAKYTPALTSPLVGSGRNGSTQGAIGVAVPVANRIWIDDAKLKTLKARAAANDPLWLSVKADADRWLTYSVPAFNRDACAAAQICYAYQGAGWLTAVQDLAFVYQITGEIRYADKVKEVLAVLNAETQAGNVLPFSADSGYASRTTAQMVGIAYAWTGSTWSEQLKTETWASLNTGFDWFKANAYERDGFAYSNYFGGHVLGYGLAGLATTGANPRGKEIADHIRAKFHRVHTAFTSGVFQGGYPAEGFVYGTNHFVRLLQYALAVKTATGEDLLSTGNYAGRIAKALIYNLKPDDWRFPDTASYSGDKTGIMDPTLPVVLQALAPIPWNGYMRTLETRMNPPQPTTVPAITRLLFGADVAPIDYRNAEPLVYHSPEGHIIRRSDWTTNAVHVSFFCSAQHLGGHAARMAGHLAIQRGTDYLLVGSGQWKGIDGWGGQPQAFDLRSWRANVLWYEHLWGPDYDGGQGYWGKPGTCSTSVDTPAYTAGVVDLLSAYQPSTGALTDLEKYLRSEVILADGTVIQRDHIIGAKQKRIPFHANQRGRWAVSGNVAISSVGTSQLVITSVSGQPFSTASDPVSDVDARTVTHRLEATSPDRDVVFLHVLQPIANTVTPPEPVAVPSGVQIGNRVITFSVDGIPTVQG